MSVVPFNKEQDILDNNKLQNDDFNDVSNTLNASIGIAEEHQTHQLRYRIAMILIYGYFGMFAFSFIFCGIWNYLFTEEKLQVSVMQVVPLVTTALGSPLGFVVAYYFNSSDKTYAKK